MTASTPLKSTTALPRILALPLAVGLLASCGYASRLPDAPTNVGGYQLADKPPSVTGTGEKKRLPPPEDAFAKLNAPVEYRAEGENPEPALTPKDFEAPAQTAATEKPAAAEEAAFAPLEFESVEERTAQVDSAEFAAPPVSTPVDADPIQNPPAFARPVVGGGSAPAPYKVEPFRPEAVDPVATAQAATPAMPEPIPMVVVGEAAAPVEAPVDAYAIGADPDPVSTPPVIKASPVAILHARMKNGAVVNVHPVVGTPAPASAMLARTVLTDIGTPVSSDEARSAPAVFDLRGRATGKADGRVSAEWTLYDRGGNIVGVFSERQDGGDWKQMSSDSLRAMGRRVADRLNRNRDLRQATLFAAAEPIRTAPTTLQRGPMVLPVNGQLAEAPMPRFSPRPRTAEPVRVAKAPRPAAPQPVKPKTPPAAPTVVKKTPVLITPPPAPPKPVAVAQAPAPRVAPAPVPAAPRVQTRPNTLPPAPPPSFDTLRPGDTVAQAAPTVSTGPRPLVFRGVSGAPGDGDQSLSREVARLLKESGANLANRAGPGALYLDAQVKKTPTANADRIEIVWRVVDDKGVSIGQVTQANDVPRGALDRSWGEDAYYAAEGAKTGIMELLQSSGALES